MRAVDTARLRWLAGAWLLLTLGGLGLGACPAGAGAGRPASAWASSCRERSLAAQRRCIGRLALRAAAAHPVRARAAASNPWLAYATAVNPGSALEFVSGSVGFRVDGAYASPWLDHNLTSGPGGATLTWPQPTVSKSADGGVSWSVVKHDPAGIWGIDFISPETGFIVGVTSLSATSDGGKTWHTLSEPASNPLVSVQFTSPSLGFGLTTGGQLVRSTDGGASWHPESLNVTANALCFASGGTGYVADEAGNLFSTPDNGMSWTQAHSSTLPVMYSQVWNELACDQDSVWQGIRITSSLLHEEAYVLQYRSAPSSPWTTLAANAAGGPDLALSPAGSGGLESLQGLAASGGSVMLAGLPYRGFAPGITSASLRAPGAAPGVQSPTAYPQLPASPTLNPLSADPSAFIRVLGVSSVGENGWVYVQDAAVNGVSPTFETLVLATSDGGRSWSTVNDSGAQNQPQYGP